MADISNPGNPTTKVEDSVSDQSATKKDDGELHSGSGTAVKGPGTPCAKGRTEEERKESRERLKTIFIILAFIVSCLALGLSYLSYSVSKRSATAAENSAVNSGKTADAAKESAGNSRRSADTAEKTFQATQCAAVYLGLPDGKVAEFVPESDAHRIALYFRNYGTITAQNTIVEVWPITISRDNPSSMADIRIPPPDKSFFFGPDIPPGFPYTIYKPYDDSTLDVLESGEKSLQLFGRIRYTYENRESCESFTIIYLRKPISRFAMSFSGKDREPLNFCKGINFVLKPNKPSEIPTTDVPYIHQEDKK